MLLGPSQPLQCRADEHLPKVNRLASDPCDCESRSGSEALHRPPSFAARLRRFDRGLYAYRTQVATRRLGNLRSRTNFRFLMRYLSCSRSKPSAFSGLLTQHNDITHVSCQDYGLFVLVDWRNARVRQFVSRIIATETTEYDRGIARHPRLQIIPGDASHHQVLAEPSAVEPCLLSDVTLDRRTSATTGRAHDVGIFSGLRDRTCRASAQERDCSENSDSHVCFPVQVGPILTGRPFFSLCQASQAHPTEASNTRSSLRCSQRLSP